MRADNSPAAQCTENSAGHPFGMAAPWDGACWAGAFDNITTWAGDNVAKDVTQWVMSGAVEATDLLLGQFGDSSSTRPTFNTPWFEHVYYGNAAHTSNGRSTSFSGQAGALGIAEMLAVPLVILTILASVIRGDIGTALKTVLIRLPLVVILCFAFVAVLTRVFDVVDALSTWVVGGTVTDFQTWTKTFDPTNVGADFVVVIVSVVIVIATLLAYIELFIRSALIYLVVAFVPLIAIATLWQGSRTALKKTVEFLLVMTFSKLVMAFAFMVGAGALTAGDAQTFAPLLVGAVIFCVIAFSPFSLFALIPIMEVAAVGAVAGMGTRFGSRALNSGLHHGKNLATTSVAAASGGSTATAAGIQKGASKLTPIGNNMRDMAGRGLKVAGRSQSPDTSKRQSEPVGAIVGDSKKETPTNE